MTPSGCCCAARPGLLKQHCPRWQLAAWQQRGHLSCRCYFASQLSTQPSNLQLQTPNACNGRLSLPRRTSIPASMAPSSDHDASERPQEPQQDVVMQHTLSGTKRKELEVPKKKTSFRGVATLVLAMKRFSSENRARQERRRTTEPRPVAHVTRRCNIAVILLTAKCSFRTCEAALRAGCACRWRAPPERFGAFCPPHCSRLPTAGLLLCRCHQPDIQLWQATLFQSQRRQGSE